MEEQQETAGKRVPVSSEKLKALQAAMDKIEKSYGPNGRAFPQKRRQRTEKSKSSMNWPLALS